MLRPQCFAYTKSKDGQAFIYNAKKDLHIHSISRLSVGLCISERCFWEN